METQLTRYIVELRTPCRKFSRPWFCPQEAVVMPDCGIVDASEKPCAPVCRLAELPSPNSTRLVESYKLGHRSRR
jgi:hypothetical protein